MLLEVQVLLHHLFILYFNFMKAIKINPSKTVLTISIGFLIVFILTKFNWALITALGVGLAGVFSDYLSEKIDFIWGLLTKLLSYIVPNILLTLVFFLFLFPIAVLARVFGRKDPLKLKNNSTTMYVEHEAEITPASFENTF